MSKRHDSHMSDIPRGKRDGGDTAGLGKQLDRLTKAIERQNQAIGKGGRGGAAGPPAAAVGRPGGVAGAAGAAGLASIGFLGGIASGGAGLALGLASTAAGLAGNIGGAGLTSQLRGGSFSGGALGQANKLASGIPVFGEGLGFAQTARTQGGALADLNRFTGIVDKLAGPNAVTPKIRQALADTAIAQNQNLQAGIKLNKALIGDKTQGEALGNIIGAFLKLAETANELDFALQAIVKATAVIGLFSV